MNMAVNTTPNANEPSLEDIFYVGSSPAKTSFRINRKLVFVIALLAMMFLWNWQPIIAVPALILVIIMTISTIKDPQCPLTIFDNDKDDDGHDDNEYWDQLMDFFSLYREKAITLGGSGDPELYNKFIDVLITGAVIDKNTKPDDIELKVIDKNPPTYELKLKQIGKTERQLEIACENALFAYSAYLVDIEDLGNTRYRITFKIESDIELLTNAGIITYDEVLNKTENTGTQIDLKHLPAGQYADGSPAYVNLAAGNSLCQGEPGSGKSVYLSALSCSILRAVPQIQFAILSPKSLDFQNFMEAIPVIQKPEEMLAYLRWAEEQGEIRKQVCLDRHIKKISKDEWEEYPPIVIMIDEYATVQGNTAKFIDPKDGKSKMIGNEIQQAVKHIVAEMRFAAISIIMATQRFSNDCIDTTLRANISGTIASFATNNSITDTMVWQDDAEQAQCYKIKKTQIGCGYIAVGGANPQAFKGAYCDEITGKEEIEAVEYFLNKKKELEAAGRKPFPKFEYVEPVEDEDDDFNPRGRSGSGPYKRGSAGSMGGQPPKGAYRPRTVAEAASKAGSGSNSNKTDKTSSTKEDDAGKNKNSPSGEKPTYARGRQI